MRRFSQRNQLVTLNDINITPLLDLAFVLLIIFIITTPLLEQSLKLNLPAGGRPNTQVSKNDARTVEVKEGVFYIEGRPYDAFGLEQVLARELHANPNLAVKIRADRMEPYESVVFVMDICERLNITRFNFATSPKRS